MAKKKRTASTPQPLSKKKKRGSNKFFDLLRKYPYIAIALLIIVVYTASFSHVLYADKVFDVPDSRSNFGFTTPLIDSGETTPQWNPYIFSGMPSYGSLMYTPRYVYLPSLILGYFLRAWKFLSFLLPLNWHTLHLVLMGLGVVLLLRRYEVDYLPATLAAIIFVLTPHITSMIAYGHGGKMWTVAYIPIVFWAVDRVLHRLNFFNIALAMLLLGFQVQRAHIQIVYYSLLLIGSYAAFVLISRILRKEALKQTAARAGSFVAIVLVALMLGAILYLPVHEYTPYSIRGGTVAKSEVVTNESAKNVPVDKGVGFDYATNWSFHPTEMSTWFIPGFYGFGGQTYWGQMPFTDYPQYMGILTLILAAFAFFHRRYKPFVWFLLGAIVVVTMIAFGRHFFLYRILYNHLPFFNKFRVPVMILILAQFAFSILAGLGLQNIILFVKSRKNYAKVAKTQKVILYGAAALFAITLLFTLLESQIASYFYKIYPARYGLETDGRLNAMRFDMIIRDLWIVVVIATIGLGTIYLYLKKNLNATMLTLALILLTIIDLSIVNARLMPEPSDRKEASKYREKDDLINFLKQDESFFRLYPLVNFGENKWAAHNLGSIVGYSPAKLRIYQDFLDDIKFDKNVPLGKSGMQAPYFLLKYINLNQEGQPIPRIPDQKSTRVDHALLNVLNTKYVISPFAFNDPNFQMVSRQKYEGRDAFVMENTDLAPRAYIVGKYKVIPDRKEAIAEMTSGEFDPREYVILEKNPGVAQVDSLTALATVTKFELHEIDIEYESSDPGLLALSEVYYPEWNAYVDDKPVEVLKADNIIRAIPIPAGKHTVQFRFESDVFRLGMLLTLIGYLIIFGLFAGAWFQRKQDTKRN
ncbi:MAG: hypothetical protein B6244_13385 [Candidatus Cloacimonetes bacterium 4572_55]|nr:MAG: hypothetical protein B6244_13385 [Candidatus Cloacimonetes bacterium 4572_55]